MTFSDNALAETARTWDAEAIRLALTASIESATNEASGNSGARKCRSD